MPTKIQFFRTLAVSNVFGLLGLMLVWQLICNAGSETSVWFRVGLWVVPLLFPLPGLLRGKPYTFAWANFILMWYFLHGFTMIYIEPGQRGLALTEILFTTAAFIGCTAYARLQGRALGLGLPKLKDQK